MRLAHATRKTATTAPKATTAAPVAPIVAPLSASVTRLVTGIKDEFGAFVDGFAALTGDRAVLAPRFMRAFDAWAKETNQSFVNFVRILDPKVPTERDGYRAHPSYQAADYLRRKQADAGREQDATPEGERPVSLNTALVYLLATVMPVIDPTGSIWTAFVREMHWTEQQATRLKTRAAQLGAVKLPSRVKHVLDSHAAAAKAA